MSNALEAVSQTKMGEQLQEGTGTADQPLAPLNVQASDGTYPDRVRVTWDAVPEATEYRVSRASTITGTRTVLTTTVGLTFEDQTVTPGATYHYWVASSAGSGYGYDSEPDSGFAAPEPPEPARKVTLSGPVTGTLNSSYTFLASVEPVTVTAVLPLTYSWQATDQAEVVRTGGASDEMSYTWSLTGPKLLTVTVTNWYTNWQGSTVIGAVVSDTHAITITAEAHNKRRTYLPIVLR